VTGAASGIGRAICARFAATGGAIVGVDVADLDGTGREVERCAADWLGLRVDITDEAQVEALGTRVRERFGRCDVLVNNAAIDDPVHWEDLDPERWRRVLAVNLDAPFALCRALVPLMRARGWGRIVNIASGSVMNPMSRFVAYRASKMGLIGFTRALATELGDDGITVNVVSPGVTRTPMVDASLSAGALEAAAQARAIKRVAEPEDVADVVAMLAGEDARFVTGQTVLANGGAGLL
jgi:NAD(P)-dependent dehydrogenase (short-subunit alcohol dehydrogenase family)